MGLNIPIDGFFFNPEEALALNELSKNTHILLNLADVQADKYTNRIKNDETSEIGYFYFEYPAWDIEEFRILGADISLEVYNLLRNVFKGIWNIRYYKCDDIYTFIEDGQGLDEFNLPDETLTSYEIESTWNRNLEIVNSLDANLPLIQVSGYIESINDDRITFELYLPIQEITARNYRVIGFYLEMNDIELKEPTVKYQYTNKDSILDLLIADNIQKYNLLSYIIKAICRSRKYELSITDPDLNEPPIYGEA